MKFSRRFFLAGVSVLVLTSKASALLHRSGGGSAFNGGKSQGQGLGGSLGNTEFPFINLLKNQVATWQGTDPTNVNSDISPSWLAADGYPNQVGGGVFLPVTIPAASSFTDTITLMWDVTGAGPTDTATLNIGNFATSPISGSLTSTGNGTNFTYVFSPTGQLTNSPSLFQLEISSLAGTAHATNFRLYWTSHIPAVQAGSILNPQYKAKMLAQKFGVLRFMDWWGTNITNVTTWSTRRSIGYPTWAGTEYRAALYPGDIMTNVGNDYSVTFGSGAPVDKQTMHILFNANSTLVQNAEAGGGGTLTVTLPGGGAAVTFNWTGHGLPNGSPISVNTGFIGGSPFQNFWSSVNYYVVNATANTFQVSLTPGGSAVGSTSTSTNNNTFVTRVQTLNLNGTGAVSIRSTAATPFTGITPYRTDGTNSVLRYGTVTYDASMKTWILIGAGASNAVACGLLNPFPPEICVQICTELGMHPHFSIPYMALDTFADYVPSLASYVKANGPGWMIPRFEPGNEAWNPTTPLTNFIYAKSFIYWGQSFGVDDWYGMVLSLTGQAVANVYGLGNLGKTYEVMCGVQTAGYLFAPFVDLNTPRLNSTQFVSSGPTPPSGFSQAAAKTYTSAMLPATYNNPGIEGQNSELINAWQYAISNAGNPTAQMANLNAYANSFNQGISGTGVITLASPGVINWPAHGRSVNDPINYATTGTIPTGIVGDLYVSNIVDADHFNVSASPGGASLNFSGSLSGTQYIAFGGHFTNVYLQAIYANLKNQGAANGVLKMFAYEGGYSPDLVANGGLIDGLSDPWLSPMTSATQATSCVLTLASTTPPQTSTNSPTNLGNPAVVGMALCLQGVGGMTQLNCANGVAVTVTAGNASIPYAGNSLVANQGIVFEENPFIPYPSNILPNTPYYVSATGLSSSAFQISATPGGAVITPAGTGGPFGLTIDVGWIVTAVSGNSVTILCNSFAFSAYTAGGTAYYLAASQLVNKFRLAVLQFATALPANMLANYNNFTAAGGAFPSQYGTSGVGTVWCSISGDMYQPLNEQGQMIAAYNA